MFQDTTRRGNASLVYRGGDRLGKDLEGVGMGSLCLGLWYSGLEAEMDTGTAQPLGPCLYFLRARDT